MATAKKESNFRKDFQKLEAIVEDFESRELDLEKDLTTFEEGLTLAKKLKKRLEEIENQVIAIEERFTEKD